MNPDYLLTCAIVCRKSADPEAGLELLEALDSPDPNERALSRALLIDGEKYSMWLLEERSCSRSSESGGSRGLHC